MELRGPLEAQKRIQTRMQLAAEQSSIKQPVGRATTLNDIEPPSLKRMLRGQLHFRRRTGEVEYETELYAPTYTDCIQYT